MVQEFTGWLTLAGPEWQPGIHVCIPGKMPRTSQKVTIYGGLQLLEACSRQSVHSQFPHPLCVLVSRGYSKSSASSKKKQVEKKPEGKDAVLQVPQLNWHLLSAPGCVPTQQWLGWTYSFLTKSRVVRKENLSSPCHSEGSSLQYI